MRIRMGRGCEVRRQWRRATAMAPFFCEGRAEYGIEQIEELSFEDLSDRKYTAQCGGDMRRFAVPAMWFCELVVWYHAVS